MSRVLVIFCRDAAVLRFNVLTTAVSDVSIGEDSSPSGVVMAPEIKYSILLLLDHSEKTATKLVRNPCVPCAYKGLDFKPAVRC